MKLWTVYERKHMRIGERKVTIVRHVTMAETSDLAVENVRKDREHPDDVVRVSAWGASEITGVSISIGCYSADPTPEEVADRDARRTMRRAKGAMRVRKRITLK